MKLTARDKYCWSLRFILYCYVLFCVLLILLRVYYSEIYFNRILSYTSQIRAVREKDEKIQVVLYFTNITNILLHLKA